MTLDTIWFLLQLSHSKLRKGKDWLMWSLLHFSSTVQSKQVHVHCHSNTHVYTLFTHSTLHSLVRLWRMSLSLSLICSASSTKTDRSEES